MIKEFKEEIFNTLQETRIDETTNTLYRCCILSSESRNGRHYTEDALKDVCTEIKKGKVKSFINHSISPQGSGLHTILGRFYGPEITGSRVFANLELLEEGHFKNLVLGLAKKMPETVGFSINARGNFSNKTTADGREIIDEIVELRCVDLVSTPACTDGIFEELKNFTAIDPKALELIEAVKRSRRGFDEVGILLNE